MNYYIGTDRYGNYDLAHHGIKGMRWGVRRYQNPDGSLTAAGRRRYGADLDILDTSRKNVARIRKGEAYRRLDTSKINNPTNNTRHAELAGRVRSAKRAERRAHYIDEGAKRVAKGETIYGNRVKSYIAAGSSYMAAKLLSGSISNAPMSPKAAAVVNGAAWAALLFGAGYSAKKSRDNFNIRMYYANRAYGQDTIKSIGSSEYADVVKRRKNHN